MQTLTVEIPRNLGLRVTPEEFAAIAAVNRDLRLERTANGELIVNPPTGGESGRRNVKIIRYLDEWTDEQGGVCFDSSTGFELPNGATRSPDASWVRGDRWDALSQVEKEGFIPLCPDFVIELRSKNDRLKPLQEKMNEYLDNGAQLGWLIDPKNRRVQVYRPNQDALVFDNLDQISDETVVPGFCLDLQMLWETD